MSELKEKLDHVTISVQDPETLRNIETVVEAHGVFFPLIVTHLNVEVRPFISFRVDNVLTSVFHRGHVLYVGVLHSAVYSPPVTLVNLSMLHQ